jgi:lysophospholipase L1-like esterase
MKILSFNHNLLSAKLVILFTFAFSLSISAQTPTPLNPNLPSLFVVGDSTANNNADGGLGWGDPFKAYFDSAKINVANRARGGRSSRTYFTEGLWANTLNEVKKGDVVLIQFGHNDGGSVDKEKMRGSLSGVGEETKEITKPDGAKEIVHTFGWYMRKFIADTKAKGATPVILSLTVRNIWKDGKVERGSGQFSAWAAIIAKNAQVEFIDLTNLIADKYEQLGEEKVKTMFPKDHTHTSRAGAELNAEIVVRGLNNLKKNPVKKFYSEKGKSIGK